MITDTIDKSRDETKNQINELVKTTKLQSSVDEELSKQYSEFIENSKKVDEKLISVEKTLSSELNDVKAQLDEATETNEQLEKNLKMVEELFEANTQKLSEQDEYLNKISNFMKMLDSDVLKDLSNASDFSKRFDDLEKKYETSEILKVDPNLLDKYSSYLNVIQDQDKKIEQQQEVIKQNLNPHVTQKWDEIDEHVNASILPEVREYIDSKFIEVVDNLIR